MSCDRHFSSPRAAAVRLRTLCMHFLGKAGPHATHTCYPFTGPRSSTSGLMTGLIARPAAGLTALHSGSPVSLDELGAHLLQPILFAGMCNSFGQVCLTTGPLCVYGKLEGAADCTRCGKMYKISEVQCFL